MCALSVLRDAGLRAAIVPGPNGTFGCDGGLQVGPPERLTDELRQFVRQHKAAITADLMASAAARWHIRWPAGTQMATINGQWQRLGSGAIDAVYTRDELAVCLAALGCWPPEQSLPETGRRCHICGQHTGSDARAYCSRCWQAALQEVGENDGEHPSE